MSIVICKIISLILLIGILSLPYIISIILPVFLNLEVIAYMPSAYLSIMEAVCEGTNLLYIVISVILTIFMYSAQLSIGVLIMLLLKKSVVVIAASYSLLLLLGPALGASDVTANIIKYTPFGIDFANLVCNLEFEDFIQAFLIIIIFIIIFAFSQY